MKIVFEKEDIERTIIEKGKESYPKQEITLEWTNQKEEITLTISDLKTEGGDNNG